METYWVPGVNNLQIYGRWAFAEFCDIYEIEVGFDFIDVAELGEGPAPVNLKVVHAGHPISFHRGLLLLRVFAPLALDLDDKVKEIGAAIRVRPMAVIHQD